MPKKSVNLSQLNITNKFFSTTSLRDEITKLRLEGETGAHYLTPAQLEVVYKTSITNGLSNRRAQELLEQNGPNELVNLAGPQYFKIFKRNLFGWFQCVLWIGALLNLVAYFVATYAEIGEEASLETIYLAIVISLTVIFTGMFGFYQEAKNAQVMSEFEKMVPPNAIVLREGCHEEIPSSKIVVGDVVEMRSGQLVPADVRIIECTDFKTDLSSLTGESKPVNHGVKFTSDNPILSKNMAFFSCPIVDGTAIGIVLATGKETEIGRIAGLVTGTKKMQTPIARELSHFIKIICVFAFVIGGIFFCMVYMIERKFMSSFHYMLGIILANVPEGLLVTLTICLTLSAQNLKSKNCLAKTMQAVETLGSTSCICTDKTGTLTINRMDVSHLCFHTTIIDKDDWAYVAYNLYQDLCFAASLCLKAEFDKVTKNKPIAERRIVGDASEAAILRYMETHKNATTVRMENPKVCELPFSSRLKYSVSIHRTYERGFYLVMKGAPEIVAKFCSTIATVDGDIEFSRKEKKLVKEKFIQLGNMGERVLGYCDLYLPTDQYPLDYIFDANKKNFPLTGLRFLGFISLIDPPRDNVNLSIQSCKRAGVRVMMVTGDHPVTALAISRMVEIISKHNKTAYDFAFENNMDVSDVPETVKNSFKAAVITGDELRLMSEESLKETIIGFEELTFARTTPKQKLIIVETCQKLGHVVAVTGDGVNDSPALKKADIGIAMGINGSEVSKQAADMILLDDNFSSIVLGIEEGRRIFENLKKTIAYTVTSNTPEMMPFVLHALIGIPLPLPLILIIVINVGTDILPALSLAYEASEMDIMNMPPRKSTDHLVTGVLLYMGYYIVGSVQFVAALYSYYMVMAFGGFFPSKLMFIRELWEDRGTNVTDSFGGQWSYVARKKLERKSQTTYFIAVCLMQICDVIICKTRRLSIIQKKMKNNVLNISILVTIFAAIFVTYTPICNIIFKTEPTEWFLFFLSIPFGFIIILGDELRRYLIRHAISPFVEKEMYY